MLASDLSGFREDTSLNMDSYNITPMRCLHSRLQKFFAFVIGSVDFFFRYSFSFEPFAHLRIVV